MNESLIFACLVCALLLFVIAYFWAALKSAVYKSRATQLDPKEVMIANVAVYREQLTELAAEFELGRLSEDEFEGARQELAQRLLEDSQAISQEAALAFKEYKDREAFAPTDSAVYASQRVPTPWIRWTVPALAVLIPVFCVGMYITVGTPAGLDFVETTAGPGDEPLTTEKLEKMATQLNERLSKEPNNADGWVMLARVERSLSHFESAEKALSKSLALSSSDDVEIERAEVLAQINHGNFKGEPWAIIQKVLKANPDQGNALLLAGSAAYSEEHFAQALKYWQHVQNFVPPNSADSAALLEAIAKAQEHLGVKVDAKSSVTHDEQTAMQASNSSVSKPIGANAPKARLMGRVDIASGLATKTHLTDTVFIYAVPVSGSRMPLAMIKTTVSQMPYDFVLDDSMAMNPSATLSSVDEVIIKARISASGNAVPQPGDFAVTKGPIKVGTQNIRLTIAEVLK